MLSGVFVCLFLGGFLLVFIYCCIVYCHCHHKVAKTNAVAKIPPRQVS